MVAFSESCARNGYIRSGPSEQLSPTEIGCTCSTAFQNASIVCAEIIVSPPRPTAAEIITGSSVPSASNTSRMRWAVPLRRMSSPASYESEYDWYRPMTRESTGDQSPAMSSTTTLLPVGSETEPRRTCAR